MHQTPAPQANSNAPELPLPRSAWQGMLAETVMEVFSILVGAAVTTTDALPLQAVQLTAVVGIAGAMRANFILRCSQQAATRLASQMLGISPDDPGSAKAASDALGEICNVLAGDFKAKIGYGEACMLSVPTVVTGRDYHFRSRNTHERLELKVAYESDVLLTALEIAQ